MSYAPCPECNRHLRSEESACPFCDVELSDPQTRAGSRWAQAGLTLAIGAGAALGVACGSGSGGGGDGWALPAYGEPPMDGGLRDAQTNDASDGGDAAADARDDASGDAAADARDASAD